MKRNIILIVLTALMLAITGCGNSAQAPKEISDPIEVAGDISDNHAVYLFLSSINEGLTKETFNKYTIYEFDFNNDQLMDGIITTKKNNCDLIFLEATSSGFRIIKSPKNDFNKIENVNYRDNFIIIKGKNNIDRYHDNRTDIYYYNNGKIVLIKQLITELDTYATNCFYKGNGDIFLVDGYTKFDYMYDQYSIDNQGNFISQDIKRFIRYEFDNETMKFTETEKNENYDYIANPELRPVEENNQKNSTFYDINVLNNGDNIEGFKIDSIINSNQNYQYKLLGEKWLIGKINYEITDSHPDGILYFTAEDSILEMPIKSSIQLAENKFSFSKLNKAYVLNSEEVINTLSLHYEEDQFLPGTVFDIFGKIKDISVSCTKDGIHLESVSITQLKPSQKTSINIDKVPFLSKFSKETINGNEIIYSNFTFVAIPMQKSKHYDYMNLKKYSFGDIQNGSVMVQIFGKLYDVKITYKDNLNDEGTVTEVDGIQNSIIEVNAPFSSDFSSVIIEGTTYVTGHRKTPIKIVLDKSRDITDFEILNFH